MVTAITGAQNGGFRITSGPVIRVTGMLTQVVNMELIIRAT